MRTVSLSILVPKFYGTRRIDLYSRTRFSTVIRESRSIQDESVCILEAGFPRYYENGLIFKNPKFLDTWRIDSYSRFWYSTVREISLGILDPHYILSGVLGKSNEFSRKFCTLLLVYFSQNLYSKTINYLISNKQSSKWPIYRIYFIMWWLTTKSNLMHKKGKNLDCV